MAECRAGVVHTSKNIEPVTEEDLHAYVDGFLCAADTARVEVYLNAHPEERNRVDSLMQQNILLHRLFDWHFRQPADRTVDGLVERYARLERRFKRWGAILGTAAVVLAIIGASGVGWISYAWFGNQNVARTDFIDQAAEAHTITNELGLPGQRFKNVGAEKPDIFQWIASQYKTMPRRAPDFTKLGFSLVGARILPTGSGPAIHIHYADAASRQSVTLFMGRAWSLADTSPVVVENEALKMIYREDKDVAYGLIGNVNSHILMEMERIVSALIHNSANTLLPDGRSRPSARSAGSNVSRDDGVSSGKSALERRILQSPSPETAPEISVQPSPEMSKINHRPKT